MNPPIVGVPCFFICHFGPSSRIVCPKWILCRNGIIHFPESAVTPKESAAAIKVQIIPLIAVPSSFPCFPYPQGGRAYRHSALPGQAQNLKPAASPSRDFSPCPGGADIFEAFSFTELKDFRPARTRQVFLKLTASLLFILSDLAGPGVGGCSAHAPEPPRAFLFLLEEKEAKDHLGGHPLKTPRGSALAAPHAGRPLLSLRDISPALRGNRPLPHGRKPLRYDITYQEPIDASLKLEKLNSL